MTVIDSLERLYKCVVNLIRHWPCNPLKSKPKSKPNSVKYITVSPAERSNHYHLKDPEVIKLQKHLSLLREEYVKLQSKFEDLSRKYEIATASAAAGSGGADGDGFVFRLLSIVSQLYNKPQYSDIAIKVDGQSIHSHKFVLKARTEHWGVDLNTTSEIALAADVSFEVGSALMKWIYTDAIDVGSNSDFLLSLLKSAGQYKLKPLMIRCEQALTSHVTVGNCIKFYQTANDINAEALKSHCSELISNHWDDFTSEDFASMPAPLLYQMFKSKSNYPLHRAIKAHREDVVFLYVVEFSSQLEKKLNERDEKGVLAIELALIQKQPSIANTLVKNNVDLNIIDHKGQSLLHKSLENGDEFSASFLIDNGINPNHTTYEHKSAALHLVSTSSFSDDQKVKLTSSLLKSSAEANLQDSEGRSPLHVSVMHSATPVFNTLLEHSSINLDLLTNSGQSALSLSLNHKNGDTTLDDDCMAAKLIEKGCSVNTTNHDTGDTLLHSLIRDKRDGAAIFLAKRKADVNIANRKGETALHLSAQSALLTLVQTLLSVGANPNTQTMYIEPAARPTKPDIKPPAAPSDRLMLPLDYSSNTHRQQGSGTKSSQSLRTGSNYSDSLLLPPSNYNNSSLLLGNPNDSLLLPSSPFTLDEADNPFTEENDPYNPFAEDEGSNNYEESRTTRPFPAATASTGRRISGYGNGGSDGQAVLDYGEPYQSPDDKLAVSVGYADEEERDIEESESPRDVSLQTPIHLAIVNQHEAVVEAFIQHKDNLMRSQNNYLVIPNFSIKDSLDQTPLAVALWAGLHAVARKLMLGGASVNDTNSDGLTLLHQAVLRKDTPSCIFLMENQADINKKTRKNESVMELAINKHLSGVVTSLCSHRAPVNQFTSRDEPLIWHALEAEDYNICDILVKYKCDVTSWRAGRENCLETLLHRAISLSEQKHACYLIANGCDINSPRKPGLGGEGGEEARDGQTPLHLASSLGQEEVVQKLMECGVAINTQDSEGRSALHVSISNQRPNITYLLLSHPELDVMIRDKSGWTPFATAMTHKDNKAAQAILDRAPTAANQFDNRGRNFLHVAILKSDIESVLFLISVQADVNSRMRDSSQLAPLHLAVKSGSEIIVRNLLLAGAVVSDLTLNKQTPLHIAAIHDHSTIASILIENGVDFTAIDDSRNNALHVAVHNGNLATCRVLITETSIDAEAVNLKGQNSLHILGQYGKENAAAIFDLFIEAMPHYPINKPDMDGNTVLLLAYMNGNGNLCRAAVRTGACLGQTNKQSVNIFNAPVATRSLLLKLLDMLAVEPPWSEGDSCLECVSKFNIKNRKHHCRHCGRLLCGRCSSRDIPIVKFSQNKPVRVCDVCFGVLTLGTS